MANSSLYAAERDGARIFRVGRVGFDSGNQDLGSNTYTATLRTERQFPGGPGSLINFRRVGIHILSAGTYTLEVKVWVDDVRTELADGTTQTVSISGGEGALSESTEEVEIGAVGSSIQIEVTVESNDIDGIFLIESIIARGRVIRQSATREGESS